MATRRPKYGEGFAQSPMASGGFFKRRSNLGRSWCSYWQAPCYCSCCSDCRLCISASIIVENRIAFLPTNIVVCWRLTKVLCTTLGCSDIWAGRVPGKLTLGDAIDSFDTAASLKRHRATRTRRPNNHDLGTLARGVIRHLLQAFDMRPQSCPVFAQATIALRQPVLGQHCKALRAICM